MVRYLIMRIKEGKINIEDVPPRWLKQVVDAQAEEEAGKKQQ